ncbi:DUF2924 domain-containing protein [Lutimaribacter saemankumensis]|uniref:DUF2924 domain-containing protein n=1 Tax=Lutimaribacter saemankumensis TaxID=490829 RepID=A0A1G8RUY7_9RHOB|nr:DUF2924 domain-containing protein [Lutimaribacter saemankumensis]SDJ20305.1 Protein of unknown function [Lutimaribacter saemankumensis]
MIRVSDLEHMDRAALIAAWTDIVRKPVPKGLSKPFLRRFLATEIQTRMSGGLSPRIRKTLKQDETAPQRARRPGLEPGSRLLREWNGVTHVVEVTDTGFEWNGQNWRSLSVIAREITGAHWSGPRFFGLGRKTSQ